MIVDEMESKEIRVESRLTRTECNHYVLNSLQLIQSLVRLHVRYDSNIDIFDVLMKIEHRIMILSELYHMIINSYDPNSLSLIKIVQRINSIVLDNNSNKNICYTNNIEDIYYSQDFAVPFGIVLFELLNNSFQHAFSEFNNRTAKISISIFLDKSRNFHCSVQDNGIGLRDENLNINNSLGLSLVKLLIENQLNGKLIINNDSGTQFKIFVPSEMCLTRYEY